MIVKLKQLLSYYTFNPDTIPPEKIFIEITGLCNLRCPLCPRTYSRNKRAQMPRHVFEKTITDIARDYPNLRLLGFHMFGEITTRDDFDCLVSWARVRLPKTHFGVSTTVSLEKRDVIGKLLVPGFDSIGVWPDGFSEDSYARIRTGGTFAVVRENIRFLLEERDRLQKHDTAVHVGIIKNAVNQDSTDKFYESFKFVDQFKNASLVTVDSIDWAGQVPAENVIHAKRNYIFKIPKPCPVPFEMLAVAANGDVTLCCMDMDLKLKIGNIMSEDSISQIWQSKRAQEIRSMMKRLAPPELCKNCHSFYKNFTPRSWNRRKQQANIKGNHEIKKFVMDGLKKQT